MADLKKKFIDILFEDDIDEEELQEDPYFAEKVDKYQKKMDDARSRMEYDVYANQVDENYEKLEAR